MTNRSSKTPDAHDRRRDPARDRRFEERARRERLLHDLAALARDFEDAPEQIGALFAEREASGACTGDELLVARHVLADQHGEGFAVRAFAPAAASVRAAASRAPGAVGVAEAFGLAPIPADDPEEHRADQVAEAFLRGDRAPTESGAAASPRVAPGSLPSTLGASTGHALDASTRARFEPFFGRDLSEVRVHTDAAAARAAAQLGAHALAVGPHILFGAGRHQPGTRAGDRLLAHELAHVVGPRSGPGVVARDADDDAVAKRAAADAKIVRLMKLDSGRLLKAARGFELLSEEGGDLVRVIAPGTWLRSDGPTEVGVLRQGDEGGKGTGLGTPREVHLWVVMLTDPDTEALGADGAPVRGVVVTGSKAPRVVPASKPKAPATAPPSGAGAATRMPTDACGRANVTITGLMSRGGVADPDRMLGKGSIVEVVDVLEGEARWIRVLVAAEGSTVGVGDEGRTGYVFLDEISVEAARAAGAVPRADREAEAVLQAEVDALREAIAGGDAEDVATALLPVGGAMDDDHMARSIEVVERLDAASLEAMNGLLVWGPLHQDDGLAWAGLATATVRMAGGWQPEGGELGTAVHVLAETAAHRFGVEGAVLDHLEATGIEALVTAVDAFHRGDSEAEGLYEPLPEPLPTMPAEAFKEAVKQEALRALRANRGLVESRRAELADDESCSPVWMRFKNVILPMAQRYQQLLARIGELRALVNQLDRAREMYRVAVQDIEKAMDDGHLNKYWHELPEAEYCDIFGEVCEDLGGGTDDDMEFDVDEPIDPFQQELIDDCEAERAEYLRLRAQKPEIMLADAERLEGFFRSQYPLLPAVDFAAFEKEGHAVCTDDGGRDEAAFQLLDETLQRVLEAMDDTEERFEDGEIPLSVYRHFKDAVLTGPDGTPAWDAAQVDAWIAEEQRWDETIDAVVMGVEITLMLLALVASGGTAVLLGVAGTAVGIGSAVDALLDAEELEDVAEAGMVGEELGVSSEEARDAWFSAAIQAGLEALFVAGDLYAAGRAVKAAVRAGRRAAKGADEAGEALAKGASGSDAPDAAKGPAVSPDAAPPSKPGLRDMELGERLEGARKALGLDELSKPQRDAIEAAHELGEPPYSVADLMKKARTLQGESGDLFTKAQRRTLIEQGWCGKASKEKVEQALEALEQGAKAAAPTEAAAREAMDAIPGETLRPRQPIDGGRYEVRWDGVEDLDDGVKQASTELQARLETPGGGVEVVQGHAIRQFRPHQDGGWEMVFHEINLGRFPRELRRIAEGPAAGMKLSNWLTIHQMKLLDIQFGGLKAASTWRITNKRACLELAAAARRKGVKSLDELSQHADELLQGNSGFAYLDDTLAASGHRVAHRKIGVGAEAKAAASKYPTTGEFLDSLSDAERRALVPRSWKDAAGRGLDEVVPTKADVLEHYGLDAADAFFYEFEMTLDLAHAG